MGSAARHLGGIEDGGLKADRAENRKFLQSVNTMAELRLTEYLRQMEPLERLILDRLAKAKKVQQTNINLNTIWKECGGIAPSDFTQAWGILDAEELVHGELYATAETIEGLGKITGKGEEALRG